MEIKAIQISEIFGGRLEGNPNVLVNSISKIEEGVDGSISFLSNPKYKKYIYTTKASVVIVAEDFVADGEVNPTLIRVKDPYATFVGILDFYQSAKVKSKAGISIKASVSESAKIGKDVYIGDFCSIGDGVIIEQGVKIYSNVCIGDGVFIGENTIIRNGVSIYDDCSIGKNCIIHSGAVVGADGFGFMPDDKGQYRKVPQVGNVLICDNVEIGANTTIDRATMGSTILREGVKIDNLVQIAHNVEIGKNTVIASQAGIAGSTKIGENCIIGGQVGIAGHLVVGNGVSIQAQSGVARNIKDSEVLQGTPALKYSEFNRAYVVFRKLPEVLKRLERVEKE